MRVNQRFDEMTDSGQVRVRNRVGGAGPAVPAQPFLLADLPSRQAPTAAPSLDPDHRPGAPWFATPGLVLVAAFAIFTGYDWLHLFQGTSFRPTGLLFAVCVAPITFALSRHLDTPRIPRARIVARISADVVLVLGLMVVIDQNSPLRRALGVASLVLAISLVALAFASKRRRPPPAHHD